MASVPSVKIVEVAKALILAAGMTHAVAQADIQKAAGTLARQYGTAQSREIEAEIARHIRNRG